MLAASGACSPQPEVSCWLWQRLSSSRGAGWGRVFDQLPPRRRFPTEGTNSCTTEPVSSFCCLPLVPLEIVQGGESVGGVKFLGCKEQDGARRDGRGEDSRPVPNACALGTLPTSARKPAGGDGAVPVLGLLPPSWAGAALKEFVRMQRVLPHITRAGLAACPWSERGTLRPQPGAAPGV